MELWAAGFGELFHMRSHLNPVKIPKEKALSYIVILSSNVAVTKFFVVILQCSCSEIVCPSILSEDREVQSP